MFHLPVCLVMFDDLFTDQCFCRCCFEVITLQVHWWHEATPRKPVLCLLKCSVMEANEGIIWATSSSLSGWHTPIIISLGCCQFWHPLCHPLWGLPKQKQVLDHSQSDVRAGKKLVTPSILSKGNLKTERWPSKWESCLCCHVKVKKKSRSFNSSFKVRPSCLKR